MIDIGEPYSGLDYGISKFEDRVVGRNWAYTELAMRPVLVPNWV